MSSKVYIETSIVSYLTGRRGRDVVVVAHQEITKEWWESRRRVFELFTSQLVINEAAVGDKIAAEERLAVLSAIPLLDIRETTTELVEELLHKGCVPSVAVNDALHIAIAADHRMDYLLTWNCKHIANAVMRPLIELTCREQGYTAPVICTPEELQEVS